MRSDGGSTSWPHGEDPREAQDRSSSQALTVPGLGPTRRGQVLAWGQGHWGLEVWAPLVGGAGLQGCPQWPPAAPARRATLQIFDCREMRGAVRTTREGREAWGCTQPSPRGFVQAPWGSQSRGCQGSAPASSAHMHPRRDLLTNSLRASRTFPEPVSAKICKVYTLWRGSGPPPWPWGSW